MPALNRLFLMLCVTLLLGGCATGPTDSTSYKPHSERQYGMGPGQESK